MNTSRNRWLAGAALVWVVVVVALYVAQFRTLADAALALILGR